MIERVEERYGLDDPLLVQFKDYWARTIHWDLGESFANRRSVNEILGEKAVNSLRLGHLGHHHRDRRRHQRRGAVRRAAVLDRPTS